MENRIDFQVSGRFALFTDPISKTGGEKLSYQIPTYQALKGIAESIYWKPTFVWVIDSLRVLHPIRTEARNMRPINYAGGNTLSIYTYLYDVSYQVSMHFEWNQNRDDLIRDRNENKHYFIAKRALRLGGRRDIFLGTRECQGYVSPCVFGEGSGYYDRYGSLSFGMMLHGIDYPDETGKGELSVRMWTPLMQDGVIHFIRPEQCEIRRHLRRMTPAAPETSGFLEPGLLDGYEEDAL